MFYIIEIHTRILSTFNLNVENIMNKFLWYQGTKYNQDTKTPQEVVFRQRPTNQLINPPSV